MGKKWTTGWFAKMKSPCLGCKDRFIGCHSKCDKYIKYRNEYDKLNKKEFMAKMYSSGIGLTQTQFGDKIK